MSPACKNCYAELAAKRYGHLVWGKNAERRLLSDNYWAQPVRWNAAAAAAGERVRVFCASMADVFEDRRDLDVHRQRLWKLIEATPHLDWLLLTKRPELITTLAPWAADWPANVWIGTTVENQEFAEERLPHLAAIPAAVRFISAEPLLGPLDISRWAKSLDWVIAGGESGGKSRPSSPSWFVDLKDQCERAGIAFHFKQWGNWVPKQQTTVTGNRSKAIAADGTTMLRMSKKLAGRELDGTTWDGLPPPRATRAQRRRSAQRPQL